MQLTLSSFSPKAHIPLSQAFNIQHPFNSGLPGPSTLGGEESALPLNSCSKGWLVIANGIAYIKHFTSLELERRADFPVSVLKIKKS